MSHDELTALSLKEAAELVRRQEVRSKDLVEACLERVKRANPVLNAFITVTADSALQEAEDADAEIQGGNYRGALHGIPIALKDLIDTRGVRTTAASAVYENRVPEKDAEVVWRLRSAGAVFLGKLNLHEFAYGGSGVISHYGAVRNPWDTTRTTGGSSSGSAAAVAAGMCFAALGTDTAGSIRLPASFCGIVGLKPTYEYVSAEGVIPLCWSYDHVGPMTRTIDDAELVLNAIAGEASSESREAIRGLRIGIAREFFLEDLEDGVATTFDEAVREISDLVGSDPVDVVLPLERSDVVRVAEPYRYHQPLLEDNWKLYQPATLARIRKGEGIGEEKYEESRRELGAFRRRAVGIFEKVDVILTPTVPCLPYSIEDLVNHPDELRAKELRMLRNTRPFNALGWPTISLPFGVAEGLPVGIQLAAAPGRDKFLLNVGRAVEGRTGWGKRLPVRI